MKRKLAVKWALVGFFVASFGLLQDVRGQSKDVIEQAKKEGKVVFYTSLTLQELDQFVIPFTKKYPFLKIEPLRGNAEQLLQKITVETRAGRPLHDVVQANAFEAWQLQKLGLLQGYKSPEAKKFPDSYKDPDGEWTINYTNYLVLGYNPKLVREPDLPKTWQDLLLPKWKGDKLALDRDQGVWYGALTLAWGPKAAEFMKALAAQNPSIRKGHTLIATLLASGEFPLGLIYAHRAEEMKATGANIDWLALDAVVSTPIVIAIGKSSAHPNAAKLLVDFFLSKEGQIVSQKEQYRIPANPDIPPISQNLDPKRLKVVLADKRVADQYDRFAREYHELFVKGKSE